MNDTGSFVAAVLRELAASTAVILAAWGALGGATNWILIGGPPCQAYSLAGRARRANDRSFEADEDLGEVPAGATPVVERLARAELSRRVERALRELPPEQREVFLLREHGELTFAQIAAALSLPRDTVKSRMRYALQRLHKALGAAQEVPTREL